MSRPQRKIRKYVTSVFLIIMSFLLSLVPGCEQKPPRGEVVLGTATENALVQIPGVFGLEAYMMDYVQPLPVQEYMNLSDGAFQFNIQCLDNEGVAIKEPGINALLELVGHYDMSSGSPTPNGPYDHWEGNGYTQAELSDANGVIRVRIGLRNWSNYIYTYTYVVYKCTINKSVVPPVYLKCCFVDAYPTYQVWFTMTLEYSYQTFGSTPGVEFAQDNMDYSKIGTSKQAHKNETLTVRNNKKVREKIPQRIASSAFKNTATRIYSQQESPGIAFDENNITDISWGRYNDANEFVSSDSMFHFPINLNPSYAEPNGYVPPQGVDFNQMGLVKGYVARITLQSQEPVKLDPNCEAIYTAFLESIDDNNNVYLRMAVPLTIKEISPDGKTIVAETPEIVPIDWLEVDGWLYTIGWHENRIYISVLYYGYLALNNPEPGDFYLDEKVDLYDLGDFFNHWLESAGTSPYAFFDVSGNRLIDMPDLDALCNAWLMDCNSGNNWCSNFDTTKDGKVNFNDFADFAEVWMFQMRKATPQFDGLYDLNHNGQTDFIDFGILAEQWRHAQ
jgi:hypothetical protein